MADPKQTNDGGQGVEDDLSETKRIMERLVRTPPKPHVKKPSTKGGDDAEHRAPRKGRDG